MPVVALVNLLFGIGFALVARDRIKADGIFATPAFPLVALHAAAIVAPIALYFYTVHAAWAWMYWIDPDKVSGLAVLPLMVGHAALVIGGWYVSAFMLRRGLQGALLYVAGAVALLLLVLIAVGIGRLSYASDYAGWTAQTGISPFAVKLGWAFSVSLLALFEIRGLVAIELGRGHAARRVRRCAKFEGREAVIRLPCVARWVLARRDQPPGAGRSSYISQVTVHASERGRSTRRAPPARRRTRRTTGRARLCSTCSMAREQGRAPTSRAPIISASSPPRRASRPRPRPSSRSRIRRACRSMRSIHEGHADRAGERRAVIRALAVLIAIVVAGCAGSSVRAQTHTNEELIATARDDGAQRCAPIELATAETHNDSAEHELDEGNYYEARDASDIARKNAELAIAEVSEGPMQRPAEAPPG